MKCKICQKELKMITNTHLKLHGITIDEYKKKYGDLVDDEFRKLKSQQSSGKNNPNFGKKHDAKTRKIISEKLKGREAYNKGIPMTEEQKQKLSQKAKERNEIWKETNSHPRTGRKHTEETKQKIREKRKKQIIKPESVQKAIETKRRNGYNLAFFKGKKHTAETKKIISQKSKESNKLRSQKALEETAQRISKYGYSIVKVDSINATIKCENGHEFTFTRQYLTESKFKKELCPECYPREFYISKGESEIANFLRQFTEVIQNTRKIIPPKEIDIYLPEYNIAVEYNGLYWHSEKFKEKNNHYEKSQKCYKKGIKLIQIFEDEWINNPEIVKSRLLSYMNKNKTIYARKCSIKEINSKLANEFINKNHIQGRGRSNVRIGLFYKDRLVAVMTFLNGDKSKSLNGWELNRYCSIIGYNVVGGASKLFKYFIEKYSPDQITTFADLRWAFGSKFYEKLGFSFVYNSPPNYWYVYPNEMKRRHRFSLRKKDTVLSERELRDSEGYIRIYDCGHAKYIWHRR